MNDANPLDAFETWVYAEQMRLLDAMKAAADAGRAHAADPVGRGAPP